jgi:hypothetical protein
LIYLLHLLLNWISSYPLSALIADAVLFTLFWVLVILFIFARFKGLKWTVRNEG